MVRQRWDPQRLPKSLDLRGKAAKTLALERGAGHKPVVFDRLGQGETARRHRGL
jgi:hypothetical protein